VSGRIIVSDGLEGKLKEAIMAYFNVKAEVSYCINTLKTKINSEYIKLSNNNLFYKEQC
jgi:hypothetical protein